MRVFYGLTTYSPLGRGDRDERAIKSIYKAAGWDLADERYLQIQGLLAAMPMTLADGLGADMERLKRFKTVLSTTAANIAPMQGEYLGSVHPHPGHQSQSADQGPLCLRAYAKRTAPEPGLPNARLG